MGAGCGRSAAGREFNALSRAELGMPGHVLAWEGNVLRTAAAAWERARWFIWSSQKATITFSCLSPPSRSPGPVPGPGPEAPGPEANGWPIEANQRRGEANQRGSDGQAGEAGMGAGCGRSAAGRESNAPSRAGPGMPGHVLAWEGNVLRTAAAAWERARWVIWSSQKATITFSRLPPPSCSRAKNGRRGLGTCGGKCTISVLSGVPRGTPDSTEIVHFPPHVPRPRRPFLARLQDGGGRRENVIVAFWELQITQRARSQAAAAVLSTFPSQASTCPGIPGPARLGALDSRPAADLPHPAPIPASPACPSLPL